ncbi:MAG TPA: hypothetical protein ENN07_02965 [candidate division Zixibacteria bacterium]|nr:hypothetical protein [candidate division Zixibacteria bacterium]
MKKKSSTPAIVVIFGVIAMLYGLVQGIFGLRLASLPQIVAKLPNPYNILAQTPQFSEVMRPVMTVSIVMIVLSVLFIASGIFHFFKRRVGRISLFCIAILQIVFIASLTVVFIGKVIPFAERIMPEVIQVAQMFGAGEIEMPWFLSIWKVILLAQLIAIIPQFFVVSFFVRPIRKRFDAQ